MTDTAQRILKEALELPPSERAELVEWLLRSLGSSVDAAWAHEVEARFDAYEAERIASSSADQAMARINRTKG